MCTICRPLSAFHQTFFTPDIVPDWKNLLLASFYITTYEDVHNLEWTLFSQSAHKGLEQLYKQ